MEEGWNQEKGAPQLPRLEVSQAADPLNCLLHCLGACLSVCVAVT